MSYIEAIKLFCAKEQLGRYTLTQPFRSIGTDWVVGTDGHTGAWCSIGLTGVDVPDSKDINTPDFRMVVSDTAKATPVEMSLNELHRPDLEEQLAIFEREKTLQAVTECRECSGTGYCECHCGDEHDCPRCDGEGEIKKETPRTVREPLIEINGVRFKYNYVKRVRKACELIGATSVTWHEVGKNNAAQIDAGDMHFVLMPLRQPIDET